MVTGGIQPLLPPHQEILFQQRQAQACYLTPKKDSLLPFYPRLDSVTFLYHVSWTHLPQPVQSPPFSTWHFLQEGLLSEPQHHVDTSLQAPILFLLVEY